MILAWASPFNISTSHCKDIIKLKYFSKKNQSLVRPLAWFYFVKTMTKTGGLHIR